MSASSKSWEPGDPVSAWARPLLAAGAAVFGAAVRIRSAAYDAGLAKVERVSVPVVSVGNLVVGGTGKTPFVIFLARALADAGRRVAIVSRGHGRATRGTVVVGQGDGPLVDAVEGGDEPVLLAMSTTAIVIVDERRARGARLAASKGAEVVILDDGFQHRRLARDLDIVLLSAPGAPGADRMLPAGRLREPLRALERAHLVGIAAGTESPLPSHQTFELTVEPTRVGPLNEAGAPASILAGERVALLSAIARPERFSSTVRALGAEVVLHHAHQDHARLSSAAVVKFEAEARRAGVARLLTTEKDAVRLAPADRARFDTLAIELRVVRGREHLDAALAALGSPR